METSNLATLLEVEFALTFRDTKAWVDFVQQQKPSRTRNRYLILLFCLACLVLTLLPILVAIFKNQSISRLRLILPALPLLGLLIWLCEDSLVAVFLRYFRDKRRYEKRRLTVTQEGLQVTVGSKSPVIPWSKIEAIALTDRHAFFRLGGKGHIILPAHAFADEADFHTFVSRARQYWQKVTNRHSQPSSFQISEDDDSSPKGGSPC